VSINATLFVQAIVFGILVWFTMRFVWPPIANALDERAHKIANGLAAAENAKLELHNAHKEVEIQLTKTRAEGAEILANAERRAQAILDEARQLANQEANKIIAAAKLDADQQIIQAKEALRDEVAHLAVKGAEQILRKEINPSVHADLLSRLKTEL
jgi:F-type H+-transporting ATPase subunit b